MKTSILILLALVVAIMASGLCQENVKQEKKKSGHGFAIKELKAFHDALHPLVHDALPKGDFGRIRSGLDRLLKRANAIQKAKLPNDLLGRKQEFQTTSKDLVTKLADMVAMKDKVDDATLEKAFNEMHETFEQLAEIVK